MTTRILGLLWLVWLFAVLPVTSARGRRRLDRHRRSRLRLYAFAAASLLGLGAVTLALDLLGDPFGLRPLETPLPAARLAAWTVMTYLGLAFSWLGRLYLRKVRGHAGALKSSVLVPERWKEKFAFAGLVLTAGVIEEYVYRGYCFGLLGSVTGSTPLAALLATAGFALGHGYQGRKAVLRTAVGGAILLVPVLATGALLPSILAHVAMDLTQGFRGRRILATLGLEPREEQPAEADDTIVPGG
jgi:membrane protease YdiL (CAAX protease family)